MIRAWLKLIVIWLIAQVLVAVVYFMMSIILSILPQSLLSTFAMYPPFDFYREVAPNIFATTITVNGIIIGFASVCAFFHIDWIDRRIEVHEQDLREMFPQIGTQNVSEQDRRRYEDSRPFKISTKYLGTKFGFSEYLKRYTQVSLLLVLFQVFFFALAATSDIFLNVTFLLGVNSIVVIATGLYSLVREVLWEPKKEKDEKPKQGSSKS